ncbi:dethiobiotin synthase [Marinimicrobium alkaliphilum]|uniref:dethiobiotin synthase n=1 Tax=Marinimicrobium alkaliphilum TaxID=2202654 RepID=UPI000DB962A0|nr:dethiobiotin synthase [Marinimicrobium alkaliphilum]
MSKRTYFVTGTDTGVGKTLVASALLYKAGQQGLSTAALKPVAAGCEDTPDGLRNDDALQLQAVINTPLTYEQINPVALAPAIAPHIAAQHAGKMLSVSRLAGYCRGVLGQADFSLVEGAGGWRVPLNPTETLADLARELKLPVILVVGMRLGCLNHALLTAEAIRRDGLTLAGWVGSILEPDMPCLKENLGTLGLMLKAPCLGILPHLAPVSAENAAEYVELGEI